MKKLLLIGSLVAAMTFPAFGAKFTTQPMLNGCNLVVSNNVAITYGTIGMWFVGYAGGVITNIQSGFTNAVNTNIVNPNVLIDANCFADENGDSVANGAIAIGFGMTNLFLPPNTILPGAGYLSASTNWLPQMAAPTASSTNGVTLVFERACYTTNFGTTAQDQMSVFVQCGGAAPVIVNTNLPATFMQGARRIRLLSVTPSNSTGSPGVILNFVNLCGFVP